MASLDELIEHNDPDPLLREIDRRSSQRDWQGVLEIRNRCNAATERGKTLWGVAEHAAYRIALEAPGELVGEIIATVTGPLALGPIPEVAASTHAWEEMAAHIEDGPLRGITAYECIALGEDLSSDASLAAHHAAFEIPLRLFTWEPEYPKAEYLDAEARFPAPFITATEERSLAPDDHDPLDERQIIETWRALVAPWLSQSNGTAQITIVEGNVDSAIAAADESATTLARIETSQALQWMCWAGASGGAHGRRRGLATGRNLTWLAIAEACGLLENGELPGGDELGEHVKSLEWWTWGDLDHTNGWDLRLAVHDPIDEISIAINAHDQLD